MITKTTTIQEITLQAFEFGIYNFLFNVVNMSRDEIFNLFEDWAVEFEYTHKDYEWNGDYYDEIDDFLGYKADTLSGKYGDKVSEYKPRHASRENPEGVVVFGIFGTGFAI